VSSLLPAIGDHRARALIVTGRLVSCTLLAFGILGMLKTKLETTVDLTVFVVHPLTAVVWFALGFVGVAMSVDPRRAQAYLVAAGALLVLWGLLALALDGSPSEFFTRDPELVALNLVAGVASLAVALVRPSARFERVIGS
jgi:Domain of unknown function (DUF4383)